LENTPGVLPKPDLKNSPSDYRNHDHICHFYSSRKEKYSVVRDYIESGLRSGNKCFYIADSDNPDSALDELKRAGVDPRADLRSGNLVMIDMRKFFLHQDRFDPDYVIKKLKRFCDISRLRGFETLRIASDLTRFDRTCAGLNKLMEYEAKLNIFSRHYNIILLCQYGLKSLEPRWIQKAIQTHPKIILQNMLCENGFYIPPSELLQDNNISYSVKRMLGRILKRKKYENKISNGTGPAKMNYKHLEQLVTDREKTLKVFQESESYFRNLINIAPVAIIMTDRDGRCLFVNNHWKSLSGLSLQESIGTGWRKAIHSEDLEKIDSGWNSGESENPDPGTECRIITTGGEIRWVDLKSVPFYDDTGDMVGYIASFSDITRYKRGHKSPDNIMEISTRGKEGSKVMAS